MTTIILYHLVRAAIALTVFYPLVVFLLWFCRPSMASLHRLAWSGVLVCPFFALSLPIAVETAAEEGYRPLKVAHRPPGFGSMQQLP
jgi:hypothetical protein